MRPFEIAPTPKKTDGTDKSVADYQRWKQELMVAYGPHCVYCNCKLNYSAEADHLVAQSLPTIDPQEWGNLILACKTCNIAKTNHHFTKSTHFIPTIHNTHLAFDYEIRPHTLLLNHFACIPKPNTEFSAGSTEYVKAKKTIKDLELDRVEQDPARTDKATDIRWKNRYEAYLATKSARDLWNNLTTPKQKVAFLADMKTRVFSTGFFSLWYQAFNDVPQALEAIINAFPATSKDSFSICSNFQAKIRVDGDL